MKTILFPGLSRSLSSLVAIAALLTVATQLHAQSAVSNFGQGSGGTANIGYANNGAAERRVFSFTTGASVGGYDFTRFTLGFTGTTGSPGSLVVDLYTAFNPSSASSPTGLVANLSLTSVNLTSVNSAVFSGSATLAGWTIGDAGYIALGGNTWTSNGGGSMMSIQASASAIPEPSTYAAGKRA